MNTVMTARLHHNEIRNRAHAFVQKWREESREEAEAKSFWDAFFSVFGIERKDVAVFEWSVAKLDTRQGFIDLFWKGVLLVEHKSRGKSLNKAESQAFEYYLGLPEKEKPNYVLLSDFATFRLYDLRRKQEHSFSIEQLPEHIHLFDFMSGLQYYSDVAAETALNIQAAELLGSLHDALAASGYGGHELEIFLVRILFCLFAEDTGIFQHHQFIHYLLNFTAEDGSDTEMHLSKLFQVLDTAFTKRSKNLTKELNDFPYVNGHLFRERLDMPSFDAVMRDVLLDCAHFDWSGISPAIFGSLFQSIMDKDARRNLGAHYTSETHILRLIKPLFLDALWAEFQAIKQGGNRDKRKKLAAFQQRLTALQFLDPACGCGNFLIITYRELRRLELAVLQAQHGDKLDTTHIGLDITVEPTIKLEHFHGIEIEEWPARIAEVAMWLTQHQMNREFARQFGREPDLLPLKTAAHIVNDNSLHLDWSSVAPRASLAHIIGNPPFIGKAFRTDTQSADMDTLLGKIKNYKNLDYVTCWFYKAAQFIQGTRITVAFVSTNSIMQGEQVPILWQPLLDQGIHLHFAHRTFAWDSEARGKAAVHVVIVGFADFDTDTKRIFDYPSVKEEPVEITAKNVNPYLIDAPDIIAAARMTPICKVPNIVNGSIPADGGNLLLDPDEKAAFIMAEPQAAQWIRPYVGAEGFINGHIRYCLWLVDCPPQLLRAMPLILARLKLVQKMREASSKAATREKAQIPALFTENRQPLAGDYLAIPRTSSENRLYVPIGFLSSDVIAANDLQFIPAASHYHFGVIASSMHMAWMRVTSGRLKSDIRYSVKLTYNNFPWPDADDKQRQKVEVAAQAVLDARKKYPASTLADMYDPRSMPPDLRKAHKALDKAVEQAYRKEKFADDMERLGYLFGRYRELVAG